MLTKAWRNFFQTTLQNLEARGLSHLAVAFESELFSQALPLDFCWFPAFLKMQGAPRHILLGAEVEYLREHAKRIQLGRPKLDPGQIGLNPSVQFLEVTEKPMSFNLEPGLYCFVEADGVVREFSLSLAEALVIDTLREDRKYSPQQLWESINLHPIFPHVSHEPWNQLINKLISSRVLVLGDGFDQITENLNVFQRVSTHQVDHHMLDGC